MVGSLRDALVAAGRSEGDLPGNGGVTMSEPLALPSPSTPPVQAGQAAMSPPKADGPPSPMPTASEAVREVRGTSDADDAPQTRVMRASGLRQPPAASGNRTQMVRGRTALSRTNFHQDPVVGWLVIIGGAGLGAYRPIFEGNNTIGRSPGQRIPIDFGDDAISSEEQAYIRYDSVDRRFLLVPNLAKTNIVAVNATKPTSAVELAAMDVITMGHTQLVFVPFCSQEFDWGELTEMKG
jgi:hypothetical protein